MFFRPVLKSFRFLLLPFALLYGAVVWVRNWLYDRGIFRATGFGLPVISVGNLATGGTGKTPMVEYLIRLLKDDHQVATLSRGYKRKTKGYALASDKTTALEIGDEPAQIARKFPDVAVAVGEERIVAIPQLLHDRPETEVILLDDAFQHRSILPGLSILLTDYSNPFFDDLFLPTGDLRDAKSSYKRANLMVVTKCPEDLNRAAADALAKKIKPLPHQKLFFSTIAYSQAYGMLDDSLPETNEDTEILLVTGIANPAAIKSFLEERVHTYHLMHYGDHHIFTIDDWREIRKRYDAMEGADKLILTTEKDGVRLRKYAAEMEGLRIYALPMRHHFLFGEGPAFDAEVTNFVQQSKRDRNGQEEQQEER